MLRLLTDKQTKEREVRDRLEVVLLTEEECAVMLQVSADELAPCREYKAHPIPCFRVGDSYRYKQEKVLEWAREEVELSRPNGDSAE